MSDRTRRTVALAWGLANHTLFVGAIGVMFVALYGGMSIGLGRLRGPDAILANALLALQFPIVHSVLLTARGREWLAKLAPGGLGRDLAPTTFAALASLQLLATFLLWTPSHVAVYTASGASLWIFRGLYLASWLLLVRSIVDAGVRLQTGYVGWSSVLRNQRPSFGTFPTQGLFRYCRQPVYAAYALTLWTGPVHTLDSTLLALVWTTYCVFGPLHKELRYLAWFGEAYAQYRARVPYFLPGSQR